MERQRQQRKMNDYKVKFNVGGQRYEVSKALLSSNPSTKLAKLINDKSTKGKSGKEVFFDRDGTLFGYVLTYLRDGRVDLPRTVRKKALVHELDYYGVQNIDENAIDDEESSVRAGYNVNFMWEEAILHSVVSKIIIYFLSLNTPSSYFSYNLHKRDDEKFADFYKSKRNTIRGLCNAHFEKVGLQILEIIKKGSGEDEFHEIKMSVITL